MTQDFNKKKIPSLVDQKIQKKITKLLMLFSGKYLLFVGGYMGLFKTVSFNPATKSIFETRNDLMITCEKGRFILDLNDILKVEDNIVYINDYASNPIGLIMMFNSKEEALLYSQLNDAIEDANEPFN